MTVRSKYHFFEKLQDISVILKGIWFLLIFDLLALFAFVIAPQGTDVLLSIAEDTGGFEIINKTWSGVWLIIALLLWCVSSEFCTRFLIYLTDNSGKSLAPHRVKARKDFQRIASKISLFFPLVLMLIAFLKALWVNYEDLSISKNSSDLNQIIIGTLIIIVFLLAEALLVYKLYIGRWIQKLSRKYKSLYWMHLSPQENDWVIKLYGILDDVRINIPSSDKDYDGPDLPRDVLLPNGMILPASPYFDPYNTNPKTEVTVNIWMFKINVRFYRCLLRQLAAFGVTAIVIILLFAAILPVEAYLNVGAAGLVCFAFACWQVVYAMLHFFDKAQSKFPIRLFIILLLIFSTITNYDHPVRELKGVNFQRMTLNEHFNTWLEHLRTDTSAMDYYRIGSKDTIPVIFVAAEGGALRTGAFTAMVLAKLQDLFPAFHKYVYCYSGVSGGALGTNFFNAELMSHLYGRDTTKYSYATERFFKNDFLAPVTGKLVFGEIINYFIPVNIERMDRAIAMEKIWEYGWKRVHNDQDKNFPNILAGSFNETIKYGLPAVFINTTEVETGLQCVWSNVDIESLPLYQQRDLYKRVNKQIAYSTAINLSTRFPLISPGAAFFYKIKKGKRSVTIRRHFVDGGYYENKGTETLFQVLRSLHLENLPVKPYILQFNFGEVDSGLVSVKSFNEIKEVVSGIYNTRRGRGAISQYELQHFVRDSLKGEFINLNLTLNTKRIPMNWILSNTAVNRLSELIGRTVKLSNSNDVKDKFELYKLFFYKNEYLRKPVTSLRK
jgi:hypothetical protein